MSVYKAIPQEDGDYIKSDGTRCALRCCRRHSGPEGINVGWTEFPSLEAALEAWGLRNEPLTQIASHPED